MRKSLLSLAFISMMSHSADAMYLIGDPLGQWDTGMGIKMKETENGWEWTGYVDFFRFFGFATELQPGMDWMTFNSNYRLSPVQDNILAEDGCYPLHFGSPEGSFRGDSKEYKLIVQKDDYGSYTVKIDVLEDEKVEGWGILGDYDNWNNDTPMTEIAYNVWTVTSPEIEGDFKFRADNSFINQYGAAEERALVTNNSSLPIVANGEVFTIEKANNVTFILDISKKTLFTKINSTPATPLALRGTFNNWEWQPSFCLYETKEYGVYSITIPHIEAGEAFRITDKTGNLKYTSSVTDMEVDKEYNLERYGTNMAFGKNYDNLTLILDTNMSTLKAFGSLADGVEAISSANDGARYYNLQGTQVSENTHGILIRVSGGKAEKVIR